LELNGRGVALIRELVFGSNVLGSLCSPRRLSRFVLIDECFQRSELNISTSSHHDGRSAPNKRGNEIEFPGDGLIPFPCR
jgi:hypothetical protein